VELSSPVCDLGRGRSSHWAEAEILRLLLEVRATSSSYLGLGHRRMLDNMYVPILAHLIYLEECETTVERCGRQHVLGTALRRDEFINLVSQIVNIDETDSF